MKWHIHYDNDVGPNDEGFWEWWSVMDSEYQYSGENTREFKCDSKKEAEWLADILNKEGSV